MATVEQVLEALKVVNDPDLHRDIVSLGFVQNVKIDGPQVKFDVVLTTPACPVKGALHDQAKAAVAKDLETRLRAVLQPMLTRWSAASGQRPARTLIVQPRVTQLRVIHGATRAFVGAFAGDSSITMDLELRDAATGAVIAKPSIARNANAMAGAWSFGATDRNLLDYITNIASEYLERHHGR